MDLTDLEQVHKIKRMFKRASYVHMAGRTGRQGAEGTCVTLLEHRQAPRLVAFAEALGVPFRPL